jgi:hypothetical protein
MGEAFCVSVVNGNLVRRNRCGWLLIGTEASEPPRFHPRAFRYLAADHQTSVTD